MRELCPQCVSNTEYCQQMVWTKPLEFYSLQYSAFLTLYTGSITHSQLFMSMLSEKHVMCCFKCEKTQLYRWHKIVCQNCESNPVSFYFVMVDLSHVERERSTSKVMNKIDLSQVIVNDGIRVAMLEVTGCHWLGMCAELRTKLGECAVCSANSWLQSHHGHRSDSMWGTDYIAILFFLD